MRFSFNILNDLVDLKRVPPNRIAEAIHAHSFEIEDIIHGKFGGLSDTVLILETGKTNRVDALGHFGLASEVSAVLNLKIKKRPNFTVKLPKTSSRLIKIDKKICPFYSIVEIKNIKISPSPKWMQSRLIASGLKPVNNIVDITNYVMLLTGQPLHAFDADLLSEGAILVHRAGKRGVLETLDGNFVEIVPEDIVVSDSSKIIALAGVMGCANSQVGPHTKNVILETANFNPIQIRRTSWRTGLRTDSASRFEKSIPPAFAYSAVNEAIELLINYSGGKITGFNQSAPISHKSDMIELADEYPGDLLGFPIKPNELKKVFSRLGFGIKAKSGKIILEVPVSRPDIVFPQDLVEEAGRIIGYDKIPEQPLSSRQRAHIQPMARFKDILRDKIVGLGFDEVMNYSFYSKDVAKHFALDPSLHFELQNPLSREQELLRLTLVPNLAKSALSNARFLNQVYVFEIGSTFYKKPTDNFHDFASIAFACEDKNLDQKAKFFSLKGKMQALLDDLNIDYDETVPLNHKYLINSLIFSSKKGKILGLIGLLDFEKRRIAVAEFDLNSLFQSCGLEVKFQKISRFPSVDIDFAFLCADSVRWQDISSHISKVASEIVSVKLFDVYQGRQIEMGKKSLAFRVKLQSFEKTFSDHDIKNLTEKIKKSLLDKFKGKFRE